MHSLLLPGTVPSSGIEAANLIHEDLCLRIGPSILACPAPIELKTAINLFLFFKKPSRMIFGFRQTSLLRKN